MDENGDDNLRKKGVSLKFSVKRFKPFDSNVEAEESNNSERVEIPTPPSPQPERVEEQDQQMENPTSSNLPTPPSPTQEEPAPEVDMSNSSQSSSSSSSSDSSLGLLDNIDSLPVRIRNRHLVSDSDSEWEDMPDFVSDVMCDNSDIELKIENLCTKEKPKHKWFAINELDKRQLGFSSKLQSRELFQRRVYGSLHCVKRLELMSRLDEHSGCVNSLNFHPDGSLLASGADDLKIVVWDWKIFKPLLTYKTKHRGNVFQSKFMYLSGDLHIVSCARDGQVRLAQLNREEGVKNSRLLGCHRSACHRLIVMPDQPHNILSAGEDGVVLNHDVRGPKSSKVVVVKENQRTVPLYSIHGHPLKSNEFCVAGKSHIVKVYDQRKSNESFAEFSPFNSNRKLRYHITNAIYNHDGSEILASYSDQDIYLFDTNESEMGKFIHQYQGHRNCSTIKGVNFFGPKSEYIVSGSDCGHIYFWERNTESLVQWLLADDNGVVNCLEPHPQLPFICTSGLDWDIKIWVPSCEEDPTMDGLSDTLRTNCRAASMPSDSVENEMLVIFRNLAHRHLRLSSRQGLNQLLNVRDLLNTYSESDSSSNSSESDLMNSDDDDDNDMVPNCNTS